MKPRPIDANKLIAHLQDYALQEIPVSPDDDGAAYVAIINCIEAVEEQPTLEGWNSKPTRKRGHKYEP